MILPPGVAIRLLLTALLGAALVAAQTASRPADPPQAAATFEAESRILPPPAGYRFPDGQTLSYEVDWRLLTAGTATLRMEAAGGEQKVNATADSTGVFSVLYPVHDRFETFIDPKTFCSVRLSKHTEEGFRRLDTAVRYDYPRHRSVLQEKNLKTGASKQEENEVPSCVTDAVSGIFYLASLPLQVGSTYTFPLNDGGKTTDVKARVEAREEVKTPAGIYKTLRVQPAASSGVLQRKGKVWIWYSDDAARIPVQMRARMFWGTLTFRLTKVERK